MTKLNPAGSALAYSTYLGGNGNDFTLTVAVDSAGNAYVTGDTDSTDFPTANPFQPAVGRHKRSVRDQAEPGRRRARVLDLPRRPARRSWRHDRIESTGSAYIVGVDELVPTSRSRSSTRHAPRPTMRSWSSSLRGDRLSHSTYIGEQLSDSGNGLAVHPTGMAFITGATESADFNVKGATGATTPARSPRFIT